MRATRRRLAIGLWLLPLAIAASAGQDEASKTPAEPPMLKLSGVILDGSGQPAAEARVGSFWTLADGRLVARSDAAETDADGKFSLEAMGWMPAVPLLAMSKDGRLGAFLAVPKADAARPVELKLEPLGRFSAKLDASALPKSADPAKRLAGSVGIGLPNTGMPLVSIASDATEIEVQLPPGRYALSVFRLDCVPADESFQIDAGKDSKLELKLEPTRISQMTGKEPPDWTVLAARGISADAKLANLRGKWVLLEFWGFW